MEDLGIPDQKNADRKSAEADERGKVDWALTAACLKSEFEARAREKTRDWMEQKACLHTPDSMERISRSSAMRILVGSKLYRCSSCNKNFLLFLNKLF